jgi:hypothetical protein
MASSIGARDADDLRAICVTTGDPSLIAFSSEYLTTDFPGSLLDNYEQTVNWVGCASPLMVNL